MHRTTTTKIILQLIFTFEDYVADKSSMVDLKDCLEDREFGTERSRNIFNTIRTKTIKAERQRRDDLLVQRYFEEACAKALFNFGRPSAPYDPDAQFWIIPLAFQLAQKLNLSEDLIVNLITQY